MANKVRLWFFLPLLFILPVSGVLAETGVYEKDVEEAVSGNQSLKQAREFAHQKAKVLISQSFNKETVYRIQKRLMELGYDPGPLDGIWGKSTEIEIKKFQNDNSLPMTGRIDSETKEKLGLNTSKTNAPIKIFPAELSFDLVLFGGFLTLALYHFCLFGIVKKEISMLYFGSLCLLTAFLYVLSVESSFTAPFHNFDSAFVTKIKFIGMYLAFMVFVMLINNLYPHEFSKIILRFSQGLNVLFALLTLVTNAVKPTYLIEAYGMIVSVFSIYLIFVLIRASLRKREGAILFLVGFLFLITLVINGILFYQSPVHSGHSVPLGVFIFTFALSVILSLRFSKSSEREAVYERFVPKEFLKNLSKEDIVDVTLGDNAEKEMSILFCDIRNFTSLSEEMTPEENFKFINSYLSVMGPVIRNHHGFIDKYIGDAIMALFEKSADDAVRAALGMLRKLDEYNEGRKRAGYAPVRIGIGINTGTLRIGTVGEHSRMEGTVISDAVNVSSRIEGMTKIYGVSLLISDETYRNLEDLSRYHTREIDRIKVKGKSEPVTIWEVFDCDPLDIFNYKLNVKMIFGEARSLYQSKRFEEANELFLDCLARNPDDKTAEFYRNRCKLYIKMGPDENMDGIVRRVSYERAI
ncbi:adenylate/guanylate cyclase domain-containing protein [Thermodesulfobacteriota bacterium]